MNTKMERPGATHDQDHPLDATLGFRIRPPGDKYYEEMEHEGEKKSVLKKVKDKAKKIKDSVTGHHHDYDDEEYVTDPEVHRLPSGQGLEEVASRPQRAAVQLPTSQPAHFDTFDLTSTNYIPIQHETFAHHEINTSKPMSTGKPAGDYQTFDPSRIRYVPGQEETLGHSRTDIGGPIVSEERPYAPRSTPVGVNDLGGISEDVGRVLERPLDLEEDPHARKDGGRGGILPENYQAKEVSDPTGEGAEEIGVTPILQRLDRMKIHDELAHEKPSTGQVESLFKPTDQRPLITGTHDQFSPEPLTPETTPLVSSPKIHEGSTLQNVASKVGSAVASEVESSCPPGGTEPELEVAVDKGVSVKEYLIEKLKPGEDDRALSELITENLPLNKKMDDLNETGSGKGVLDKIKDAASSLFGKDQTSSERCSDNSTTGY